jgi:ribosomal protein L11 methyltransferase
MCLEWLEHYITPNCSTLDYGCGSGILAIAAAKLGATDVVGIDIDPQAVTAAQYNITNNHVNVHIGLTDDAQLNRQFDIVVANILANPLRLLAPLLCSKLNAAGKIILAGLLSEQAEELIAIYQRAGITLRIWREQEGWATLTNTPASQ